MSAPARLLGPLLLLAAISVSPASGQSAELARIDSLLDRGRFTEARSTLGRWLAGPAANQGPDDVAYALLLRGRLTTRADSALASYLELALGHPSSRYAPQALLRLGQGYVAIGQPERAARQLQRLVRDYPTFPQRPLALLWLSRAQRAARMANTACPDVRAASTSADPDTRRLLQQELGACAPPPPAAAETRAPAAAGTAGSFTIQAGAFRDRGAAEALARRLEARGITARVVFVGSGTLAQVRAGRFASRAAAATMLRRVQELVPGAIVAADAHRERAASR